MEILDLGVAALLSAPGIAAGWWVLWARRGRRRNARDACARCGRPLYGLDAEGDPHRVQGRLVCGRCAATLRTRMLTTVAAIGLLAAAGAGAGLLAFLAGEAAGLVVAGGIVAEYGLLLGGAAWWMKRRNAQAVLEERARPSLPGSHPEGTPPTRTEDSD